MHSPSVQGYTLLCRGLEVPVDFPCKRDPKLAFVGRHRTLTMFIVNHWTSAENPPAAVYRTLTDRKLSIHFIVDQAGIVHQCADTELRCAHAGHINAASIGIEFINRGTALTNPNRGHSRRIVQGTVHNKAIRYYEFTEAQLKVAVKLNRTLCGLYGLPLKVPLDARGDLLLRELLPHELERAAGCLGHLHVDREKPDPGPGLLRALRDAGESAP